MHKLFNNKKLYKRLSNNWKYIYKSQIISKRNMKLRLSKIENYLKIKRLWTVNISNYKKIIYLWIIWWRDTNSKAYRINNCRKYIWKKFTHYLKKKRILSILNKKFPKMKYLVPNKITRNNKAKTKVKKKYKNWYQIKA
jgi:hypothetical protein